MIEELKVERRYVCKGIGKVIGENRKNVNTRLGTGVSKFATTFNMGLRTVNHNCQITNYSK